MNMEHIIGFGFFLTLLTAGCNPFHGNESWDGKLYVGDSKKVAAVRSQDDAELACSAPAFDEMVCMSKADFKDLVLKWRAARANCPASTTDGK